MLTGFVARRAKTMMGLGWAVGCRRKIGIWSFGKLSWATSAISLCWRALVLVLLSTAICAAADRKQSSWNKSAELKRAGYTDLTGRDAVRFLVGNSVLVQKSGPLDSEKNGVEIQEKIYYFLSDHTFSKDQAANACPKEGTYYSPDGSVIHFTCEGSPDPIWSIGISHWKIKSGLICRDGPSPKDIGIFAFCKPATVSAIFAPQGSGVSDKVPVQDLESGSALTGYAGNALN